MDKKIDCTVATDYEEMEKLLPIHVKTVRSRLQDKHKFIVPPHCNAFLSRCIRVKDYDVDKAVKLVLASRAAISNIKHWSVPVQPSFYQGLFDCRLILPLSKRDALGRRIFVFRAEYWDPQQYSFDAGFSFTWMLAHIITAQELNTQINGYVTVWDFTNLSAKQLVAISPWKLISISKWANNGVMGRIKELHGIHHPTVVDLIYRTCKPFLKEKLRQRIMFHNDLDRLHEHVDPENLPSFLGGKLDNEECIDRQFIQDTLNYENYFNEMLKNGIPSK